MRATGVDDVLTPKNFKQLQEEYSILSVVELHRFLEEYSDYLPVEDFKSWVKAGMPESSDEEKHKKVSHLLRQYEEIMKKKALESWGLDPEDSDDL